MVVAEWLAGTGSNGFDSRSLQTFFSKTCRSAFALASAQQKGRPKQPLLCFLTCLNETSVGSENFISCSRLLKVFFLAKSVHIMLALPQTAQLSLYYRKISSVASP